MLDHDGVNLTHLQAAVREAARRGHAIASADTRNAYPSKNLAIVIADDQGTTVFEVPVDERKAD